MAAIAIVGMACRYPDARSPAELWENVLAQRRAFRRMPPERLRLEDYYSAERSDPDCTYATEAALIEGYEFDRVHFRISGNTFRSTDLAHWLALDIASQALADAGFADGAVLPWETTAVFLGNTLTGEFSRASLMRLRWPYVRRVVEAALIELGWTPEQRHAFLEPLEAKYKEPFPPVSEETLAGGLSNTIAGRICNHFDLRGGGYTVDGACASSLLAVTNACTALDAGDLDLALAGGVDLSLDPFELVGFAKTGALAAEEMRIYDTRSAGFWPGEGCGFVLLMRLEEALAQGRRVYAVIRGWGISSDGSGGITRPEIDGQLLALRRAYQRARLDIQSVTYVEGHGTGTAVGDTTELRVLCRARAEAGPVAFPAYLGSIKANIGHTKAAAGVAGLIKAALALHTQILPPTTGCEKPHPELTAETSPLRILSKGEPWPLRRPLRAGVSAMGFGGINTHVVLEGMASGRRRRLSSREWNLLASAQDAELFLLSAPDANELARQLDHLLGFAAGLSRAEMTDLAAQMEKSLCGGPARAALIASSPAELTNGLETLRSRWSAGFSLGERSTLKGVLQSLTSDSSAFVGHASAPARIGFLFPGQGSPAHLGGGAWRRRFTAVQELYDWAGLPDAGDGTATAVAQPAVVAASLAGLNTLDQLGIRACLAIGHSLGELAAFYWAGALDEKALVRIASARGKAMADLSGPPGAMAAIGAGQHEVEQLLGGVAVVIAGLNSPRQTVVSGETSAVATVLTRARARGWRATPLPVSHAFHSSLVAAAVPVLSEALAREEFWPLQHTVISTVTGGPLTPAEDLPTLLCRQVISPVRFLSALAEAAEKVDLWIEVGPGHVLSGLLADFVKTPAIALDACGPSLKGLLQAVGAAFVLGAPVNHAELFSGRLTRPIALDGKPRFFVNPCELAPLPAPTLPSPELGEGQATRQGEAPAEPLWQGKTARWQPRPPSPRPPLRDGASAATRPDATPQIDALALVQQLVAERAELPLEVVKAEHRLLADLHLNSIAVGQVASTASRRFGLPPPASPTDFADATVAEIATALETRLRTGDAALSSALERVPSGIDSWIHSFVVALVERPLPSTPAPTGTGTWRLFASKDHPLASALEEALAHSGFAGVIVCLPPNPDERHIGLLLEAARALGQKRQRCRFVLVQQGGGGAAFARTLHLEMPDVTTCVVDVPLDHPQASEWVVAEVKAAQGYSEAHYDASGRRREPRLRLLTGATESTEPPLGPADVLLVTGGGKGIAAECALALARQTNVRLVLMGRSHPAADAQLSANLERIAAAGITFRYLAADVTDAEAVRASIGEAEAELGPITAVLHAAGTNVPRLLGSLDETDVLRTLAPKVHGARHLLAALNPDRLRLFIAFGSIIARTGMRGEADYGLANEWLSRLVEDFHAQHPACRCLVVEWSVWSGVGMGQRLGRVDALLEQGITPISPDVGVAILRDLLARRLPQTAVVVSGRFGEPPTLRSDCPELPFLRFLEKPRVHYPGIELIVDAELSTASDPYLDDHVFQGERLVPAVIGLEAMAQTAMALVRMDELPVFEEVKLHRPVVIPRDGSGTVRIAALVRGTGLVDVALRSGETAFQVDHFRGLCRFGARPAEADLEAAAGKYRELVDEFPQVELDPLRDLYGGLLFHTGRFRRIRGYRLLRATTCTAEIATEVATDWFGRYLPPQLVLGDPGARDAVIHAIQACIPHATILPVGVERLVPNAIRSTGPWFVHARERAREGDTFVYDLEVTESDGHLRERWEGLRLRRVGSAAARGSWVEALLGPYIERRIAELIPAAAATVQIEHCTAGERRARSDQAIQRALGTPTLSIHRRPDGKPELAGRGTIAVSVAHAGDLTLAVAGAGPIGCDLEPIVTRPAAVWPELLGPQAYPLVGVICRETGEEESVAATRMWAVGECLKKAGAMIDTPLVLDSATGDGWVVLGAGSFRIVTYATVVAGAPERLVLAVLVGRGHASL